MSASDFELALRLQEELNREFSNAHESHESHDNRNHSLEEVDIPSTPSRKRPYSEFDLDGTQQIVHPLWETLVPTPDVFGMFKGFDTKFFQGKLHCVELEWSKKMYSCAGICYQRKNSYGMACTIRLSEPLLKLRSRKNLVETLLHEMIHAYLFILNVREGNGGHGPNFKRIMTNINKAAGTNITVYHTFHDEVNFYKTHIWRCNGICQHRGPFFGYVRRTANRAPGPNDQWWAHHHEQCGGNFLKVSEPDPVAKKPKGKATSSAVSAGSKIDNPRWGMVKKATPKSTSTATRTSTVVVRKPMPTTNTTTGKSNKTVPFTPNPTPNHLTADLSAGRSLSNVVGFKDLNGGGSGVPSATRPLSSSNGRTLGASGPGSSMSTSTSNPRENVRDIWNKKFSASDTKPTSQHTTKSDRPNENTIHTPLQSNWVMIDDDIEIENVVHETVTILDDSTAEDSSTRHPIRQSSDEVSIKREIIDSFGDDLTDSDIELIDCDYDDDAAATSSSSAASVDVGLDRTITDNLFSWNKSTEDLNKIHMTDEENAGNPDKELVSCPVCNIKCERESMSDHLDGCLGITRKIDPRRRAVKPPPPPAQRPPQRHPPNNKKSKNSARTSTVVSTATSNEEEEFNRRILREMEEEARNSRANAASAVIDEWTDCPVCAISVKVTEINDHLDTCLS